MLKNTTWLYKVYGGIPSEYHLPVYILKPWVNLYIPSVLVLSVVSCAIDLYVQEVKNTLLKVFTNPHKNVYVNNLYFISDSIVA